MSSPEMIIGQTIILFQTSDSGGDKTAVTQTPKPILPPTSDPRLTEQQQREGELARRLTQGLKKVTPRTPRSTERFPDR